jgi:hypothetical protein
MSMPIANEQREMEIKARGFELLADTLGDCQVLYCMRNCVASCDKETFVLCHMAQLYALAEHEINNENPGPRDS